MFPFSYLWILGVSLWAFEGERYRQRCIRRRQWRVLLEVYELSDWASSALLVQCCSIDAKWEQPTTSVGLFPHISPSILGGQRLISIATRALLHVKQTFLQSGSFQTDTVIFMCLFLFVPEITVFFPVNYVPLFNWHKNIHFKELHRVITLHTWRLYR